MYETSEPHGLRVGDLAFDGHARLMVVHTPTDKRFAVEGVFVGTKVYNDQSLLRVLLHPDTTFGNAQNILKITTDAGAINGITNQSTIEFAEAKLGLEVGDQIQISGFSDTAQGI